MAWRGDGAAPVPEQGAGRLHHPCRRKWQRFNPPIYRGILPAHGTAELTGVHGIELKDFDLTGLAAVHPHLKELRLWGAPGNLGNFSAVGGFRELTNLSTFDLFGFGADDIPTPEQMPELRWFWMTSLPEDAAKAAKRRWKSKPGMDLRITNPGNRSGWRKTWTIPSGAGTVRSISLPPLRKRQPINTARPVPS